MPMKQRLIQENTETSTDGKSTGSPISLAKDSEESKSSGTDTGDTAVSSSNETDSTKATTSNSTSNTVSSTNASGASTASSAVSTTQTSEDDSTPADSGKMKGIGLAAVALFGAYFVFAGGSESDYEPVAVPVAQTVEKRSQPTSTASTTPTPPARPTTTTTTSSRPSSEITLVGAKYLLFDVGSSYSVRVGSL